MEGGKLLVTIVTVTVYTVWLHILAMLMLLGNNRIQMFVVSMLGSGLYNGLVQQQSGYTKGLN